MTKSTRNPVNHRPGRGTRLQKSRTQGLEPRIQPGSTSLLCPHPVHVCAPLMAPGGDLIVIMSNGMHQFQSCVHKNTMCTAVRYTTINIHRHLYYSFEHNMHTRGYVEAVNTALLYKYRLRSRFLSKATGDSALEDFLPFRQAHGSNGRSHQYCNALM